MASKRRQGKGERATPAWNMTSVVSTAVGESLILALQSSDLVHYKSLTYNPPRLIIMSKLLSKIFQGLLTPRNSVPKNRNNEPRYQFFNLYLKKVPRVNFVSENAMRNMSLIQRHSPEMTHDSTESTGDSSDDQADYMENRKDPSNDLIDIVYGQTNPNGKPIVPMADPSDDLTYIVYAQTNPNGKPIVPMVDPSNDLTDIVYGQTNPNGKPIVPMADPNVQMDNQNVHMDNLIDSILGPTVYFPKNPMVDPTELNLDPIDPMYGPKASMVDVTQSSGDPTDSRYGPKYPIDNPTDHMEDRTGLMSKPTQSSSDPTSRIDNPIESSNNATKQNDHRTVPAVNHSDDLLPDRTNTNSPSLSTRTRPMQELEKTKNDNPPKPDTEPEVYKYKYQQKLNRFDFLKQQLLRHPNETYLSKFLDKLHIKHKISAYKEKPFRLDNPEVFCKNLLLKDRKGRFYYLICAEDKAMNLKLASKSLGAHRNLSFASEAETDSILHVQKGGITPFALMHETAAHVTVAITTDLVEESERLMNFHPFEPNLTLSLTLESLQIYLKVFGHGLKFITV